MLGGNFLHGIRAIGVLFSYLSNSFFCKPVLSMILANRCSWFQIRSRQMFPICARNNSYYGGFGHSELIRNLLARFSVLVIDLSDFYNLFIGKLVHWMIHSKKSRNPNPLLNSILSIIFCCSKKQMIRIAARRIVAFVANHQRRINDSVLQYVSQSVSTDSCISIQSKKSISFMGFACFPFPALIWRLSVYFCPKTALRMSEGFDIFGLHNKFVLLCRAPGCFYNAGAISFQRIFKFPVLSMMNFQFQPR